MALTHRAIADHPQRFVHSRAVGALIDHLSDGFPRDISNQKPGSDQMPDKHGASDTDQFPSLALRDESPENGRAGKMNN